MGKRKEKEKPKKIQFLSLIDYAISRIREDVPMEEIRILRGEIRRQDT